MRRIFPSAGALAPKGEDSVSRGSIVGRDGAARKNVPRRGLTATGRPAWRTAALATKSKPYRARAHQDKLGVNGGEAASLAAKPRRILESARSPPVLPTAIDAEARSLFRTQRAKIRRSYCGNKRHRAPPPVCAAGEKCRLLYSATSAFGSMEEAGRTANACAGS